MRCGIPTIMFVRRAPLEFAYAFRFILHFWPLQHPVAVSHNLITPCVNRFNASLESTISTCSGNAKRHFQCEKYFSPALPHEGSCLLKLVEDNNFEGEGASTSYQVADEQHCSKRRYLGTVSVVAQSEWHLALEQLKNPCRLLNPNCLFGSLWPWKHLTYLHLKRSEWQLLEAGWERKERFEFGFWKCLIKTMYVNVCS